ncbi:histidine kinase [Flammeovirga pectinis]|uniref:Histidine kinase n=1 Tax=Flammeovirga pectinis TaxID=2494373 RepID=A0A3S9P0F5_9BACT|nr:histidine kinase [Flammeovirga pectinis]AZQ61665.1 histidine kinase [Flammeovirga pectinis]
MKEYLNFKIPQWSYLPVSVIVIFITIVGLDVWISIEVRLFRAITSIIVFLLVVLVNSKILVPKILIKKKKTLWYVLSAIVLYFIGINLFLFFSKMMFPFIDQDVFFTAHPEAKARLQGVLRFEWIYPFSFGSLFVLMSIFISTVLTVSSYDDQQKKKQQQLKEGKIEAELKFLRAQINPHFLFNALNNIYTMSYMQMPQAPDNIAKLSEMLRYLLYDCNEDLVELSKDISYLNNYIDFQQLKTEVPQNINFKIDVGNQSSKISPMLLEPFVENAFKYSRLEENMDGFVKIELVEKNGKITFNVKNTVTKNPTRNKVGGIGIENVRLRLNLIYPDRHQLIIKENTIDNNLFEVALEIQL